MRYFIGLLWLLFIIFFHILIKYSIQLQINSILLNKEKEKYSNIPRNNIVQENIVEEVDEVDEDEELLAQNLENYINNNQGQQMIYESLEKSPVINNKFNMKTIESSNSILRPFMDDNDIYSNFQKVNVYEGLSPYK